MKPAKKVDVQVPSQSALKRQYKLEDEISRLERFLIGERERLKNAEVNQARQGRLISENQFVFERAFQETVAEVNSRRQKILSVENHIRELRAEIAGLQLTPSQGRERLKKKDMLARLARKRANDDSFIDAAISQVLGLLKTRRALTDEMLRLAGELDFSSDGLFDSARFDTLASSLPRGMAKESKEWLSWLLGEDGPRQPFKIIHTMEVFAETLRSPNVYKFGDIVLLTEKERELASYDPPAVLGPVEMERFMAAQRKTEPEATGKIQWGILRG